MSLAKAVAEALLRHVDDADRELARACGASVAGEPNARVEAAAADWARARRAAGERGVDALARLDALGRAGYRALGGAAAGEAVGPLALRLDEVLSAARAAALGAYEAAAERDAYLSARASVTLARALNHELNNRLLAARFGLDLLEREAERGHDGLREPVQLLDESLESLRDIATDLQALAVAEADESEDGARRPAARPVRELVEALLRDLRHFAGQRNLALACDGDGDGVLVDGRRARRLLVHLICHAIKRAAPAGGEVLRVVVRDGGCSAGRGCVIEVRVRGEAAAELARQTLVEGVCESRAVGAAGLRVARATAEELGARFEVHSRDGESILSLIFDR